MDRQTPDQWNNATQDNLSDDERVPAAWLAERAPALEARPGFISASQRRVLMRLAPRRSGLAGWWQRLSAHRLAQPVRRLVVLRSPYTMAASLTLLALLLLWNGSSLIRAANTWLPGDPLYPLLTFFEGARLATNVSQGENAAQHIEYARRRLLEAQSLVLEGRYEQVPDTLYDFNQHFDLAVIAIDQLARHDHQQASLLADELRNLLAQQQDFTLLAARFSPLEVGRNVYRALSMAYTSLYGVQDIYGGG